MKSSQFPKRVDVRLQIQFYTSDLDWTHQIFRVSRMIRHKLFISILIFVQWIQEFRFLIYTALGYLVYLLLLSPTLILTGEYFLFYEW